MRRTPLLIETEYNTESQLIGAILYNIEEALKSSKKAQDASTIKQLERAHKNAKDLSARLRSAQRR